MNEGVATITGALITIGTGVLMLAAAKGIIIIGAPIVAIASVVGLVLGAALIVRGFVHTISAYRKKKKEAIAFAEGKKLKKYTAYRNINAPTKTPAPAPTDDAPLGLASHAQPKTGRTENAAEAVKPTEEKIPLLPTPTQNRSSFFKKLATSNLIAKVYASQEAEMKSNAGMHASDDQTMLRKVLSEKISSLKDIEESDPTQQKKRKAKREGLEAIKTLVSESLLDANAQQNSEGHLERLQEDWAQLHNRLRADRDFMASFFLEVSACMQILNMAHIYFEQVFETMETLPKERSRLIT